MHLVSIQISPAMPWSDYYKIAYLESRTAARTAQ
jgi:hypothetical protein